MYAFLRRNPMLGVIAGLLTITLTSLTALAGHLPADPFVFGAPFTVNPSAAGEPQGPFLGSFVDFSYVAEVDQTAGAFTETGAGFFSTFRHPNLFTPVSALTSGLNVTYQLYSKFSATGTVAPGGGGGIDGVFTTFSLEIFLDAAANTSITPPAPGLPNGSVVLGNTGDDILVADTGVNGLVNGFGGFHIFPGLAAGDFDVILELAAVGGYFTWPGGFPTAIIDFNGVNSSLFGIGLGDFTDGLIQGSGNMSAAAIPEPGTLLLLGTGLAVVGMLRRFRKRA